MKQAETNGDFLELHKKRKMTSLSTCQLEAQSAHCSTGSSASSTGDPHLHLAEGGKADFRGKNNTFYSLLSAAGLELNAMTQSTMFLLPRPQLVDGSFFTRVSWVIRTVSAGTIVIYAEATRPGFTIYNLPPNCVDDICATTLKQEFGCWKKWSVDDVIVLQRVSTLTVSTREWEMNATRKPVYNSLSSTKFRYDISLRQRVEGSCFPHGIIGQSFDRDGIAVDGKVDNYAYKSNDPFIKTTALAEGAIEGVAAQYEVKNMFHVNFTYSRFAKNATSICLSRNLTSLSGRRSTGSSARLAQVVDN